MSLGWGLFFVRLHVNLGVVCAFPALNLRVSGDFGSMKFSLRGDKVHARATVSNRSNDPEAAVEATVEMEGTRAN